MEIQLYTDGGCRGNPGIGGWGCILKHKSTEKAFYGAEEETTNNRMELTAVIEGLTQLKRPCSVVLYSDSSYVCNGIEKWLDGWKKKHWKGANKQPIKNQDLWMKLDELKQTHQVKCVWVKGHAGHAYNEQADALVNQAMDEFQQGML